MEVPFRHVGVNAAELVAIRSSARALHSKFMDTQRCFHLFCLVEYCFHKQWKSEFLFRVRESRVLIDISIFPNCTI